MKHPNTRPKGARIASVELIGAIVVTFGHLLDDGLRAERRRTAGARWIASALGGRSASTETHLVEDIEAAPEGHGACFIESGLQAPCPQGPPRRPPLSIDGFDEKDPEDC